MSRRLTKEEKDRRELIANSKKRERTRREETPMTFHGNRVLTPDETARAMDSPTPRGWERGIYIRRDNLAFRVRKVRGGLCWLTSTTYGHSLQDAHSIDGLMEGGWTIVEVTASGEVIDGND